MVFLYIPNIIDYFRFLCLIVCLFTWTSSPLYTVFFYLLNMILDEFDGRAARKFNQTSTFGAVLDMVCDRSTDAVMTSFLSHLYPQYNGFFYGIMILDISSHWLLMYATALEANSHKSIKT